MTSALERHAPLAEDRARMLAQIGPAWETLEGDVFLTGGTGFVGSWLLEALLAAIDAGRVGSRVHVLTRDPAAFERRRPHLALHPAMRLHRGDVRDFGDLPLRPALVIHGATEASASLNAADGRTMLETIVDGTRRTLAFAEATGARRVLLLSSGAVYGPQPAALPLVDETYGGGPSCVDPLSAYAEGKRMAELRAVLSQRAGGPEVLIARLFAFVGPYLPIDRHFAAGNFVRDALDGGPIRIQGDGTPLRSYLYGADMAAWLWTILLRGEPGRPYNVGSEAAIAIADLARAIAVAAGPTISVEIAQTPRCGELPARYVPATARARQELGLHEAVGLEEAIARTLAWHRGGGDG